MDGSCLYNTISTCSDESKQSEVNRYVKLDVIISL